jgi:hypothetical protein
MALINTLKISKALETATVPKIQADAIAEALAEVTASDLASKSDISDLRTDLKDLELRLSKDVSTVRDQLTGRINVILWAVCGVGVLTWILQIFGTEIRHAFGLLL